MLCSTYEYMKTKTKQPKEITRNR